MSIPKQFSHLKSQARWLTGQEAFQQRPARVLTRLAAWRLKSWRGEHGVVRLESLDSVFVVPPEWRGMSKLAYAFEDLAEPELPWVGTLAPPGSIAVDAGSHYGDYTLALAQAVGADGEVWAVDPSPRFMAICRANVALNHLQNVRFLECGLSHSTGRATLVSDADPSRSHIAAGPAQVGEVIELRSLDSIYEEYGAGRLVSFIKLDIEFSEMAALTGSATVIREHRPVIMIELQQEAQSRAGSSEMELWEHLKSLGYGFAVLGARGALVDAPHPNGVRANFVARPIAEQR